MAEEVAIANTTETAKIRNPVGTFFLMLVPFYGWYWYYQVNREMADLGRARGTDELGDSPGTSLLAVTLGALIIVPAVMSLYNTVKRVQAAERLTGNEPLNGWIALVLLLIISPGMYAYMQSSLNEVWTAQFGGAIAAGTQQAAVPAPAQQQAPPPPRPQ